MAPTADGKKTTIQQEKYQEFANQLIIDFNPQAAYERCKCYKGQGAAAKAAAFRLLQRADVQAYIREGIEKRNEREIYIQQDDVLKELRNILKARQTDYQAWNAEAILTRPSEQLSDEQIAAIKRVYLDASGMVRIELYDRQAAIESAKKHLGMDKQTIEHTIEDKRSEIVAQVHEMLKQTRDRMQSQVEVQEPGNADESSG